MQLSKQDTFCWEQIASKTVAAVSENVLDFGAQGFDAQSSLFIVALVTAAMDGDGTFAVTLETCAAEGFDDSAVASHTLASGLDEDALAAGVFIVKNARLPKGLLRYNRLVFTPTLAAEFTVGEGDEAMTTPAETITTAPAFSAFIVDGRVEPLT